MTDTMDIQAGTSAPRRSGSLSALKLAELQGLASSMGITGTAKMRKGDLVEAIKAQQGGVSGTLPAPAAEPAADPADAEPAEAAPAASAAPEAETIEPAPASASAEETAAEPQSERDEDAEAGETAPPAARTSPAVREGRQRNRQRGRGDDRAAQNRSADAAAAVAETPAPASQSGPDALGDDDDTAGGRRRRNRNRRDKRRTREDFTADYEAADAMVAEDDVLLPIAGILDVLDNYAFVRTTGYLAGPTDVYVPLGMVKRSGLRKGDAVTGAIRAPREGEPLQQQGNRQKYNPLVRLDAINGLTVDQARTRPEFGKLTPIYPQDRLRLETDSANLTTRVIDLVAPIGKGQRGLVVAPDKAGATMLLQSLANAVTTNNPEVHLMVVLVDERPEDVTEMQRAVKGEVISSTFDRPADDHTTVAELAIERAKRLVEMGHDVVVLLDSLTKLGRAYNLSAPASGRVLAGGVDAMALYPPKKFFGAARNIEHGGSLTIIATASVQSGSRMDEVIFEELKGIGNMELTLDRHLANRRTFPAIDANNSGTRREELLLAPEELKIVWTLRRLLAGLDAQQGIEMLIERLRKTRTNYEFLMQVQATSSEAD